MIFNSVTYILFLIISVVLYFWLPKRPRLWMLFAGSIIFYGFWRWDFVWLMVYSIVLDYVCSIMIDQATSLRTKRIWLTLSMISSLGVLFYFKYLLFTISNLNMAMEIFGSEYRIPYPDILLPLGISFYTFQTMSYVIDVYRGFVKPERDFVLFATYVTFFPQLVAGPILRGNEVVPWLVERPPFRFDNLLLGLRRIVNGLFLKVVLADNIAEYVDAGFAMDISYLSALDVWTLTFLFGFQIYFDFSAYSHIALGSAKLMGIDFPENFNFPYFSTSPREFWKRWHISLSSWIRDYLYLPLCGVKVRDESVGGLSEAIDIRKATLALFLTWAIMGMWHGANWTFLYWGLFHATWVALYRQVASKLKALPYTVRNLGGWVITLPIAMASWIPFRAETVSQAFAMHLKLLTPNAYLHMGLRENTYIVAALVMLGMTIVYLWKTRVPAWKDRLWLHVPVDIGAWAVQLSLVFIFLRPVKQFIYFQF